MINKEAIIIIIIIIIITTLKIIRKPELQSKTRKYIKK